MYNILGINNTGNIRNNCSNIIRYPRMRKRSDYKNHRELEIIRSPLTAIFFYSNLVDVYAI